MSTADTPIDTLPTPLAEAEKLLCTMEHAVTEEGWDRLPGLAEGFRRCLMALQQPLGEAALRGEPAELDALRDALGGVLARHQQVLDVLVSARARTAEELDGALQGHRGASHYLLAAGGA